VSFAHIPRNLLLPEGSGLFPEMRGTFSSISSLSAARGRNRHDDGVLIVSMIAMTLPDGYENHGREAVHSDGTRHREDARRPGM